MRLNAVRRKLLDRPTQLSAPHLLAPVHTHHEAHQTERPCGRAQGRPQPLVSELLPREAGKKIGRHRKGLSRGKIAAGIGNRVWGFGFTHGEPVRLSVIREPGGEFLLYHSTALPTTKGLFQAYFRQKIRGPQAPREE